MSFTFQPIMKIIIDITEKIKNETIYDLTYYNKLLEDLLLKINNNKLKQKEFDLSNRNIDDRGAIVLANYLRIQKKFNKINIANNEISVYGLVALMKVLKTNTTLTVFDISSNNISEYGVKILEEVSKINKNLKKFNIANNKIESKEENKVEIKTKDEKTSKND